MKLRFGIGVAIILAASLAAAQMLSSHAPATPSIKQNSTPSKIAAPTAATGKAVARVNGVVLTDRELLGEMYTIFPYAQQHNGFPKELEPEIRRGALQMIIFEELVYEEAKRRRMTISPARLAKAEAQYRKQFGSPAAYQELLKSETNGSEAVMREKIRRSLLIEDLLNQEVNGPARVTAVQTKARYQKNLAQYKHGEMLRIQSISIIPPNETKAVLEEARKRAADAIKQAKQAKTFQAFGLLAESISDDDFHVNMGDHRNQDASALPPPIVKAAAKMKPGDVSDLIQLGNNYTIFRLDSRTPAGTTPFSEVQDKLRDEMQKEKTQTLRSALADKLRKNAKIETL